MNLKTKVQIYGVLAVFLFCNFETQAHPTQDLALVTLANKNVTHPPTYNSDLSKIGKNSTTSLENFKRVVVFKNGNK